MKTGKTSISVILTMAMIAALFTGCSKVGNAYENGSQYMDINETISKDSKWINSDVIGAVTKDMSVSEKDDLAAAANKEWILSVADQVEKKGSASLIEANADVILQQKQELLKTAVAGGRFGENKVGMDTDDYEHMEDVFTKIVSTAADWDTRNEEGIKPLEPYIADIDSIRSLDQMDRYLCNEKGEFLSGAYLIPFQVGRPLGEEKGRYLVTLGSSFDNSLDSTGMRSLLHQDYVMEAVKGKLKELGYSPSRAEKIVKQCWQLETALSEHTSYKMLTEAAGSTVDLEEQFNHVYTKEELKELSGDYPVMDILKTYDYDQSDSYLVYEPNYVQEVAKLYKEKNLEKIKSYYIVHTVLTALPLLTREDYDQYKEYFADTSKNTKKEQNDPEQTEDPLQNLSEEDQILQEFVTTYICGIFEKMYVVSYCSAEQKSYVQRMIREAIEEYKNILEGEDWMSDLTKEKAIEKLDHMTTRVLYPDELKGCNDLQVEAGNLLAVTAKVEAYNLKKEAAKINTEVDKTIWDLEDMPTTEVNAYYSVGDNSVTILSGVIASGELFDLHASDEENLAHLGYIIGHEISHAFDSQGYLYDKDGNEARWWTAEDEEAFQKRVTRLVQYFSTFKCFRTLSGNINGDRIKGEAIADMGGLKCMLQISKKKENFDYKTFFYAFAHTWATCRNYAQELQTLNEDVHPLPFLRTNVTVQQFDEFYEAFDIQPGDGMYLAPKDRISVW